MRGQLVNSLLYSAFTLRRSVPEKVTFVALNGLDLVLTLIAISLGLKEMNPLMMNLVDKPFLLFSFKLAIPIFIAWLVPGRWLVPALILILIVLAWDIRELLVFLS